MTMHREAHLIKLVDNIPILKKYITTNQSLELTSLSSATDQCDPTIMCGVRQGLEPIVLYSDHFYDNIPLSDSTFF